MKIAEAIEILKEYNDWRIGANTEMLHPKDITMSINTLISAFEDEEHRIFKNVIWKLGNSVLSDNNDKIKDIIKLISDYCYHMSNSYEGQSYEDYADLKKILLKKLDNI